MAGSAQAEPVSSGQPAQVPVTLAITSMSPSYAMPGRTMVIKVAVRNVSAATMGGLAVRLWSSSTPFTTRDDLEHYALGSAIPSEASLSIAPFVVGQLAPGASAYRTIRVPVKALRLSCFGVYPLTAQVTNSAGALLVSDPALLPYWPGKHSSCQGSLPKRSDISWVWPMIDQPHQGACPGLDNNNLAASIAPGGRLSELLAIGRKYATRARLTWAIDPALQDNAQTMTTAYLVGGDADCKGSRLHAPDPNAAGWLKALSLATSGQTVFATPYADVDVAALTQHSEVNRDLRRAFVEGQGVSKQILGLYSAHGTKPAPSRRLAPVAWPADGIANYALLENLAAIKIGTVILDSTTMPPAAPVDYTPGAVTAITDGVGTVLHVLLADDTITALLGSPDAASAQPGAIFRVRQLFLAETAMIVAQEPGIPRPIVVAPPRRWDPSDQLAGDLLADTVSVPWLRPASTGQLLALPVDHLARVRPESVSKTELSGQLLRQVAKLDRRVALFESILVSPNLPLYRAVFGIESSAWRGGHAAARPAQTMMQLTSRYLHDQLAGLSIGGQTYVTLGGRVGPVPVAITNELYYPVHVKLAVGVSNSSLKITVPANGIFTIPARQTTNVKLTVHATADGAAVIRLHLTSPLTGRSLPVKPLVMQIRATHFGTLVLIICAALLGVFVITSAARAIRHGRPAPPAPVASAAGEAGPPDGGPADRPDGTEEPDTVEAERPELTSAGPPTVSQGPTAPGRLPTEGH